MAEWSGFNEYDGWMWNYLPVEDFIPCAQQINKLFSTDNMEMKQRSETVSCQYEQVSLSQ